LNGVDTGICPVLEQQSYDLYVAHARCDLQRGLAVDRPGIRIRTTLKQEPCDL
jgi:hypothetical protein